MEETNSPTHKKAVKAVAAGLVGDYTKGLSLIQEACLVEPSEQNSEIQRILQARVTAQQQLQIDIEALTFPLERGETFTLPDGRLLGYEIHGARKPEPPATKRLLFLHGTPGSRFFMTSSMATAARERGISIYAVERPGFGLSSPQPQRSLLSFAEDLKAFVLGLDLASPASKLAVIGYSAGGPYAAACAHVFPELLSHVVLVSSPSPPEAPGLTRGMTLLNKFAYWLSQNWFWATKKAVGAEAGALKKEPIKKVSESLVVGPGDGQIYMLQPEIERIFVISALEMYSREGGVEAEAQDYSLFTNQWGFELPALSPQPRYLVWYGLEDQGVVPSMGEFLAKQLPACLPKVLEKKGHLLLFEVWKEILDGVMSL